MLLQSNERPPACRVAVPFPRGMGFSVPLVLAALLVAADASSQMSSREKPCASSASNKGDAIA